MGYINDISQILLSFFSASSVGPKVEEDFSEVRVSCILDIERMPDQVDYQKLANKLNSRDNFHLSVLKHGEIVENFTNRYNGDFESYVASLNGKLVIGENIEVVLTLVKNAKDNILSIYYLDKFIEYLNSLSFLIFLNVIEKHLGNSKLILEIQNDSLEIFHFSTGTILFKNKNSNTVISAIEIRYREKKIFDVTTLCHWDIEKRLLLPEDLYPEITENANSELIKVFQKACLLYTTMFVFDYLSLKEDVFQYKLNGFKTFGQEIKTKKIDEIDIDFNSIDLFYNIYQWIYAGGNSNDKISIARNIISLNYEPETLKLAKTSFDSILSNYKIYERQNVKQYIEVRNKLSEILIDLQGKIDKIVDGFISDYKKNIITLISFFISVIVIRVVSKGDFIGGFTNEIIVLSYSFLLISIGVLIYSRWEFYQRVVMFDKHYLQLKERYKDLLSEEESNRIFEECNPKNIKVKCFVHQQIKFYSILWVCSILVMSLALAVIYVLNNIEMFSVINKLVKFICYTRNM